MRRPDASPIRYGHYEVSSFYASHVVARPNPGHSLRGSPSTCSDTKLRIISLLIGAMRDRAGRSAREDGGFGDPALLTSRRSRLGGRHSGNWWTGVARTFAGAIWTSSSPAISVQERESDRIAQAVSNSGVSEGLSFRSIGLGRTRWICVAAP